MGGLTQEGVNLPLENPNADVKRQAEQWVAEHADYLYRSAQRHGLSPAVCEDLVQETLLAGMAGYARYRGESSERSWLRSILRNKLVDHLRRTKREDVEQMDQASVDSKYFDHTGHWLKAEPPPEQQVYNNQVGKAINCCMQELNERSRQLFMLAEIEGFSPQQLAEASALTPVNVRVLLHRARLKMRDCLTKKGMQL